MTIYLSGPMRGYPGHNFNAFRQAATWLEANGHRVISPARLDIAEGFNPDTGEGRMSIGYYIHRDVLAILNCDAIALMTGWAGSVGAMAEAHVAQWAGKAVWIQMDDGSFAQDSGGRKDSETGQNGSLKGGDPMEIVMALKYAQVVATKKKVEEKFDNTKARPFYCGTQFADWAARNCDNCTVGKDCEIGQACATAFFGDGSFAPAMAKRMGWTGDVTEYTWDCPERKTATNSKEEG
jgi:hypothetical protein